MGSEVPAPAISRREAKLKPRVPALCLIPAQHTPGSVAAAVNLKTTTAVILPARNGYFGKSRELQPRTSELQQNHRQVQKTSCTHRPPRQIFSKERDCYKPKAHWSKLGAGSGFLLAGLSLAVTASHWLGCCQGRRKPSFLLRAE